MHHRREWLDLLNLFRSDGVTSLHEKKCGSLVKDIGFCRIWPFFPSPRSKEESKVTRRSGRVRSTEWEKRSMDQVHLLWARILMGFFVRNASTRPFRSESRRCQVIDIKNEDFSNPHQSLPYDFEWFHSGRTMKNDQLSPAFEAWSGIMKLRRQSEPTAVGEDCLPHLSMKKTSRKVMNMSSFKVHKRLLTLEIQTKDFVWNFSHPFP